MAVNIVAYVCVSTKMASGNVRLDFYSTSDGINSNGDLRISFVMTAANFTAINTTVNGGATGATLTQGYAQDASRGDYVQEYAASI
jgi:hypothetical protein